LRRYIAAYLLSYYMAHRDWDWADNGRKKLPANHVVQVRFIVVRYECTL